MLSFVTSDGELVSTVPGAVAACSSLEKELERLPPSVDKLATSEMPAYSKVHFLRRSKSDYT